MTPDILHQPPLHFCQSNASSASSAESEHLPAGPACVASTGPPQT